MDFLVRTPLEGEMPAYFELRWRLLRAPWHQPRGSEKDEFEEKAVHAIAVVGENNEVIGAGRLHFPSPSKAQIRFMAVMEKAREKGVGSAVLVFLEQSAVEKGVGEIVLNARENAVKFYEGHGYSVIAPVAALFGIPHFKMSKKL